MRCAFLDGLSVLLPGTTFDVQNDEKCYVPWKKVGSGTGRISVVPTAYGFEAVLYEKMGGGFTIMHCTSCGAFTYEVSSLYDLAELINAAPHCYFCLRH